MASGFGRDVWRENSPDSLLDLTTRWINLIRRIKYIGQGIARQNC